jgi:serine/threonine-protein kinase
MAEDVFGIVGSLQAAVFRVERVVAEGGFGVVYRAHHEGFKAAVALKCLKIPGSFTAAQRAAFLAKFREEGEVLFRLSALIPSVVRPLHVGTLETPLHPFVPFIALEWLDGDSLDQVVERRRRAGKAPLDLTRVARMMGPVARGLECAHRFPGPDGAPLSILHRDLKPENLLLARVHGQDTLKILDFGIAKVRSAATQMVGRATAEQGELSAFTPAYGAPEQWLPKRFGQTGPWTDVWGFALCAAEALTGRVPFEGDAAAVMAACLYEQRRPTPLTLGVVLPERAEAAFEKALAVDPARRFHDIGEFWDEIEAAAGARTPRITSSGLTLDSMLPPVDPLEDAATSRRHGAFDATERDVSRAASPRLTLGLNELERNQSPAAAPSEAPPLELHLSVMPNNSLEQLDAAPPPRRATAPEPMASRRLARAYDVRRMPSEVPTMGSVLARLAPALRLIGVGVAITLADIIYATFHGAPFALGPVRALWIAGPLVGVGVVKLVLSLAS